MNTFDSFDVGEDAGGDDVYWMSIGDLMSGLMFIFILALSVFMINITEVTDQLVNKDKIRQEILQQIKKEMESKGFTEFKIVSDQGILRLEQGVLFNSGEDKLLPRGERLLKALGPVIADVLDKPKFKGTVETIFIEGHTDNDPIIYARKFDNNWDLSAQRAIKTWLFMSHAEPALKVLKNEKKERVFSVSGYADSRPIASNATEAGKRLNRRIDFRFNMVPPESDQNNKAKQAIESKVN